MVDTENLVFFEDFTDLAVDFTAALKIVAQRLFKHNTRIGRYQTGFLEVKSHIGKQRRAGREIIDAVAIRMIGKLFMQDCETGFIPGGNLNIGDACGKLFPDLGVKFAFGNVFFSGFFELGAEFFIGMFAARGAENTGGIIETPGTFHFVKCGEKFA